MVKKISLFLALATLLALTALPALAQAPAGKDSASLAGRYQFVKGDVSADNSAVTLPLYEGSLKDGSAVWYILTDVSDQAAATKWGINYAPALAGTKGQTRIATAGGGGKWQFD